MHCPFCNHSETQVMETRELDGGASIRRRRRCGGCDRRFTTYERVELSMPDVLKSDGRRVPYQRDKLAFSMKLALRKRPVSDEALNAALDQVESRLFKLGAREIASATIGEHVMDVLRSLDTVAYVRFASVYRKFEDLEAFASVIQEIAPYGAERAAGRGDGPAAREDGHGIGAAGDVLEVSTSRATTRQVSAGAGGGSSVSEAAPAEPVRTGSTPGKGRR